MAGFGTWQCLVTGRVIYAGDAIPPQHMQLRSAVVALYFVAHERSRWFARTGLVLGISFGLLYGFRNQRAACTSSHMMCGVRPSCGQLASRCTPYGFRRLRTEVPEDNQ